MANEMELISAINSSEMSSEKHQVAWDNLMERYSSLEPLEVLERIEAYKDNPAIYSSAEKGLQNIYSYGLCYTLALALHRRFSFEIALAVCNNDLGEPEYIGHAWVIDNNGKAIDIMGYYDTWNDCELAEFGEHLIRNLDESGFYDIFYSERIQNKLKEDGISVEEDKLELNKKIEAAEEVLNKYLIHKLDIKK